MEKSEEFDEIIDRYLQGQMSQEEEEIFMQQLSVNARLRKEYENELLMSALLEEEKGINTSTAHQPLIADQSKPTHRKSLLSSISIYKNIAAAILVIAVIGIVTYLYTQRNNKSTTTNTVVNRDISKPELKKSIPVPVNTDSLYLAFYSAYRSDTDPVEVNPLYQAYENRQYKKVTEATTSDYQTMGTDNRHQLLQGYMQLYKGLSFLEQNMIDEAITSFKAAQKNNADATLFYTAQWYSALSYLKANETAKADSVIAVILKSNSVYKQKAQQLAGALQK